jgi:hypothetical protein
MPNNPLAIRESRWKRTLYSHSAKVVVAQFERDDSPRHTRSLYIRDAATLDYERLPAPDDATSYETPVVARSVPLVFFNVMVQNEKGGGNWLHVARANIITREIETVYAPPELAVFANSDPAWPCRPWVAALFDVSDDGLILTCSIGLPEPLADGAFRMNYSLFDLDLASRTLTLLADSVVSASG